MKLLADSGSTKCDWVLITPNGKEFFRTIGLNPKILSPEKIILELTKSLDLQNVKDKIIEIEFYGSGCSSNNQNQVKETLQLFFKNSKNITVENDLMAAVKATCGEAPGYVAILGTGSNLGYFDGKSLQFPVTSLGYLLGDEGSGNAIGKKLMKDYFYGKMPSEFSSKLNWKIHDLYAAERPNFYLADKVKECSFMHKSNYFQDLILGEFNTFFSLYKGKMEQKSIINFVGSIAFQFSNTLQKSCEKNNFILGKTIKSPIQHMA